MDFGAASGDAEPAGVDAEPAEVDAEPGDAGVLAVVGADESAPGGLVTAAGLLARLPGAGEPGSPPQPAASSRANTKPLTRRLVGLRLAAGNKPVFLDMRAVWQGCYVWLNSRAGENLREKKRPESIKLRQLPRRRRRSFGNVRRDHG